MLRFLERDQPGLAATYFPGGAPPPAEAFIRLRDAGYQLTERRADDVLRALGLEHPDLGTADLWCDRAAPPLAEFIEFANNLSDAEMSAGLPATTLLTDWMLMTPAGTITPRSMAAARRLREHADEIRASMAEAEPND